MILLFCLVLSHGGMGPAAPHAFDDQHAHAPHSANHHDQADASDNDHDNNGDERTIGSELSGHHVHLIGDLAPANLVASPHPLRYTVMMRITSEAPPGSLRTPPLLEPPSA